MLFWRQNGEEENKMFCILSTDLDFARELIPFTTSEPARVKLILAVSCRSQLGNKLHNWATKFLVRVRVSVNVRFRNRYFYCPFS